MSFSPLSISRGASASSCCLLIDDVDKHLVPTFVTALNAVSDEDEGRASPSHAGRMFLRAMGTIPCCIPRANTWLCDAIALLAKSIVSVARLRGSWLPQGFVMDFLLLSPSRLKARARRFHRQKSKVSDRNIFLWATGQIRHDSSSNSRLFARSDDERPANRRQIFL
jgi:hypothetical protein